MPKEYRHIKQYLLHKNPPYDETRLLIGAYIQFCNNERIQLKTKLTPLEKRCLFVA